VSQLPKGNFGFVRAVNIFSQHTALPRLSRERAMWVDWGNEQFSKFTCKS
jgi:hypothetical protein